MLIFLYVEEKWMKGEQVSTRKYIQTHGDILSSGNPVSVQTWKDH